MTTRPASIPLVSTIFGLTYLALALGKIPGLRIDRAGIALVGAAAMLAGGVLSMHDAARAVDYETIVLLFGMMVVVSYLRLAGLLRPGDGSHRRPVLRALTLFWRSRSSSRACSRRSWSTTSSASP